MKLFVARHGETVENVEGRIQGQSCGTLSALGVKQARNLGARLLDERFDAIFSSDVLRARQTTEAIAGCRNELVHYRVELREKGFGVFEGGLIEDYLKEFHASGETVGAFRPEGGETFSELMARMDRLLREVLIVCAGGQVLFVTHRGPLCVLLSRLLGIPLEGALRTEIDNASLWSFDIDQNGSSVVGLWNDTSHLAGLGVPLSAYPAA